MAPASEHSAIINRQAKAALASLGLKQKGRSRLWYDDQRWRAFIVEFQPSSWSKGTYCNVGAMWLWDPGPEPRWQFHVFERVGADDGQFVSYEGDSGGFEGLVVRLVADAAARVQQLRHQFSSIASVADYYKDKPAKGWPGYHSAVALAISGSRAEAATRFKSVAADALGSDIAWVRSLGESAQALGALADRERDLRDAIESQMSQCRDGLRLPSLTRPIVWF